MQASWMSRVWHSSSDPPVQATRPLSNTVARPHQRFQGLIDQQRQALALELLQASPDLLPHQRRQDFPIQQHWHRRYDQDPRNRWLRDQVAKLFGGS